MTTTVETPQCVVCKRTTIVQLDADKVRRWRAGEHIQNVWPAMPPEKREVLISGTHPECWDALFDETKD